MLQSIRRNSLKWIVTGRPTTPYRLVLCTLLISPNSGHVPAFLVPHIPERSTHHHDSILLRATVFAQHLRLPHRREPASPKVINHHHLPFPLSPSYFQLL